MRFIFYVSLYGKDTRCKMDSTDFCAINGNRKKKQKINYFEEFVWFINFLRFMAGLRMKYMTHFDDTLSKSEEQIKCTRGI